MNIKEIDAAFPISMALSRVTSILKTEYVDDKIKMLMTDLRC